MCLFLFVCIACIVWGHCFPIRSVFIAFVYCLVSVFIVYCILSLCNACCMCCGVCMFDDMYACVVYGTQTVWVDRCVYCWSVVFMVVLIV